MILEKQVESLINQRNKPEDSINDMERFDMEALVPLPVSTTEELQLLNETLKSNSRYFTFLVSFFFIMFCTLIFIKLKTEYGLYFQLLQS